MKLNHTIVAISAVVLACAASTPGFASDRAPMGEFGPGHRPHRLLVDPAPHLAELKRVLQLTEAQLPAWNAYEQTILENAKERRQLIEAARANGTPREQVREQLRALHMSNRDETMTARRNLFSTLTEEQKAAMRAHFREKRAAHRAPKG